MKKQFKITLTDEELKKADEISKYLTELVDKAIEVNYEKEELKILQEIIKNQKIENEHLIARNKELEEKNKTLETLLQGNLYQMYLYYKELAGRYQANSISKDKVKEKIEELNDLNSKFSQRVIKSKEFYLTELVQNILQEFLEES